jgi:hypothetical protein
VEKKDETGPAGIIKMFDRNAGRALVLDNANGNTLRTIDRLWAVVWADCPQLTEDNVEVVVWGYGRRDVLALTFKVGGHPSEQYQDVSGLPKQFYRTEQGRER